LRREVERETGIPPDLTDTIVHALKGADHLGSLLKVDAAVEEAIRQHEAANGKSGDLTQKLLSDEFAPAQKELRFDRAEARLNVVDRLEAFLAKHTSGDDLGLRLRGEQLAAGVRFVRLVRQNAYHVVVGNPPYLGTGSLSNSNWHKATYHLAGEDLYALFIYRALELTQQMGYVSLVAKRGWMFAPGLESLRSYVLDQNRLCCLGDLATNAFSEIGGAVVSVVMFVIQSHARSTSAKMPSQASRAHEPSWDRKQASLQCGNARFRFMPDALSAIPQRPIIYWWSESFLEWYRSTPTFGDMVSRREGLGTRRDVRYLRYQWETNISTIFLARFSDTAESVSPTLESTIWVPLIKGAAGRKWIEPLETIVNWRINGLEIATYKKSRYGRGAPYYFRLGVAFTDTGAEFFARIHRYASIIGDKGPSLFSPDASSILCTLNAAISRAVLQDLAHGLDFQLNDVDRLPVSSVADSKTIVATLDVAFSAHEACRETSVEFKQPGPSVWRYAQEWAQIGVDRPDGEPLPPYEPEYASEPLTNHVSFALGVTLGRFGPNGEGILDPAKSNLSHALPAGILFLDGTLDGTDYRDGLGHKAAKPLLAAWAEHGAAIAPGVDLRDYLRTRFFEDVHRKMYENRPIHWPLSSEKKTFVAWVTIHRWTEGTLRVLLADHLKPTLTRLEGELNDLRTARDGADKRAAREAEKRFPKVQKWRDELAEFIKAVEQCAEKGPPPADGKCPPREADARYAPDLDDGVMINSAALWPLLTPQWKDPKKWWKELATSQGKRDYDWAHLAMRYWPTRVDKKCQEDPSLGVAHGCFWRYHPARAWTWELRLQDEIGLDFRIEEASCRGDGGDVEHRAAYLRDHADEALETIEKEVLRRRRKKKEAQAELRILERGFWSRMPDECWDLEIRVMKKQGEDFHLLAPDGPEVRRAYEQAHPDKVGRRERLLAELRDQRPLFEDEEIEEDGAEDEEAQSVAEEE